jgi:hypothetical protein
MTTDICLIVLTSGRKDLISQTIPAWIDKYKDTFDNKFIVDDSGDENYREWLKQYSDKYNFKIINVSDKNLGYIYAMQKVLDTFKLSGKRYMFFLEEDFIPKVNIDFDKMKYLLENNKEMIQISLMRQPWYQEEIDAGGLIESRKENFENITEKNNIKWVKHRAYFTGNPSLISDKVLEYGWPNALWSETLFGKILVRKGFYFGILGLPGDHDWLAVEHIGYYQKGIGNY